MAKKVLSKRPAKLSTLAIAICASHSFAQQAALEEITVTAQKREQNIQDIPISIAAFSADALKDKGIDDFNKLGTLTPGLNLAPSTGFFDPIVTIRGIGLRFEEPNVSASAAVHIDEVAMATPSYLNVPLFDLERVEVLKGPQGTLFGQNTTAGAINFITRKPSHETDAYIDLSYGRFNETDIEAAIGGSLSENVAARLAIKQTQSDGHQNNLGTTRTAGFTRVPGVIPGVQERPADSEFGGQDKFSTRFSLLWDVADDIEVYSSVHYFNDQSDIPLVKLDGADALGMLPASADPYIVEGDELGINDHEQWGGQLRVSWDLGFAEFTSLSGYETLNRHMEDSEGTATRVLNEDLFNDSWQFSQEFRLVGETEHANWTAGVHYAEDEVDFFKRQDASDSVLGFLDTKYTRTVESWALFSQVDWLINEALNITTGVRYLEEDRSIDRSSTAFDPYGTALVGRIFPDLPIIPGKDSISAEELTWRLGLDYRPTEELLVYASVSEGYKSGGFDGSGITSNAALEPFDGEELLAYEAGIKWTSQEIPLRINASVFFYDYDNLQAQALVTIVGQDGTRVQDAILTNAGKAEIRGAEFDLNWQPFEGLRFDLGATYLDGEITEFASEDPSEAAAVIGNDTPNTPTLQTSAQIAYRWNVGEHHLARVALDYSYIDDVFGDLANSDNVVIDSYELLNGRLELSSSDESWTVGLWGKNLADERYYTSIAPAFLAQPGVVRRSYALPRTYGIDVKYHFY
ncbi:TonB-dependent receptor [Pseudoteredinibacter isoporae]|uniref:Iron complex outermembrane receptor protein n=1 Tax=Pseudoteredinibacter isoporae TaxID=570281 RepID=A0A7X0JR03_9GAMM|nr:TonB-dependent receptor [Pseudoteredinibacter isoporae]MBB6519771.1 iron complex outermembrane receptor protein [Pseudoteredinibacter isoporae]NHO85352.1 TonB-dependent receptor [Pseudoteredinibacter isoporae]NIB26196.1 TonB-dependent receptor [Pseudoteredinibacter isoporae]